MPIVLNPTPAVEQALRELWGDAVAIKGLEALVIQAYRERKISVGKVAELLNLGSSLEADRWLAERRVSLSYDESDFADDVATSTSMRPR